MAKYPNKLVKFNTFNIIELISYATDIDISPIRQIDISIDTITDIEISHIEIRSEDLDDYRYEIENNGRDIDIYKNSIDNSSTDIEDNISGCNSKIDYNKISNNDREVEVVRYNSNGSCYKYEINNKSRYVSVREYNINRLYNYERGATTDDPWLVDGEVNPPPHLTTETVARSSQDAHVTT